MTKICLIGYGKMGKMIHELAGSKACEVVSIIDPLLPEYASGITRESLQNADVAIDFSHPAAAFSNLEKLISLKQNTVVGTTGWHDRLSEIMRLVQKAQIGFLYGANFSIGMNLFSRLVSNAVEVFDSFEDYDLYALEKHHAQKQDSPSGTAIELANLILAASARKNKVVWDKLERRLEPEEFHFASVRGGSVPGTHSLCFDSPTDTIELNHVVRSRATFAHGALMAARWIADKQGVYSFSQMIQEILC